MTFDILTLHPIQIFKLSTYNLSIFFEKEVWFYLTGRWNLEYMNLN